MAKANNAFLGQLAGKGLSTATLPRLSTTCSYRGVDIEHVPVVSPLELCTVQLEAFIRGPGVNMGDVAELWCEGALVSEKSVLVESIGPSLLDPTKVARSIASGFALDDSEEAITA